MCETVMTAQTREGAVSVSVCRYVYLLSYVHFACMSVHITVSAVVNHPVCALCSF